MRLDESERASRFSLGRSALFQFGPFEFRDQELGRQPTPAKRLAGFHATVRITSWDMAMDTLALRPVAEMLFSKIRELSFDGVGVTRESYGKGESAAADFLREFARQEGLEVGDDRAANLLFRLPGQAVGGQAIWCGSHLDSVPQGGNYDGLAGVVAGLMCLIAQKRS